MTYAMSDLHGRYDLYIKMLEKITFTGNDTLYILGDFVDRGDEGLKIVLDSERQIIVITQNRNNVVTLCNIQNYL